MIRCAVVCLYSPGLHGIPGWKVVGTERDRCEVGHTWRWFRRRGWPLGPVARNGRLGNRDGVTVRPAVEGDTGSGSSRMPTMRSAMSFPSRLSTRTTMTVPTFRPRRKPMSVLKTTSLPYRTTSAPPLGLVASLDGEGPNGTEANATPG